MNNIRCIAVNVQHFSDIGTKKANIYISLHAHWLFILNTADVKSLSISLQSMHQLLS